MIESFAKVCIDPYAEKIVLNVCWLTKNKQRCIGLVFVQRNLLLTIVMSCSNIIIIVIIILLVVLFQILFSNGLFLCSFVNNLLERQMLFFQWFPLPAVIKHQTKHSLKKGLLAFKTTLKISPVSTFHWKRNNAFAILTSYCTLSSTPDNTTEKGSFFFYW